MKTPQNNRYEDNISMTPRLLNISQASDYLGIGESTIWKLVKQQNIPVVNPTPRSTRFDIEDLNAYINDKKKEI
jgi:excisionase family DNA binding protein